MTFKIIKKIDHLTYIQQYKDKDEDFSKIILPYATTQNSTQTKNAKKSAEFKHAYPKKIISLLNKHFYLLDDKWIIFVKIFHSLVHKFEFAFNFLSDRRNFLLSSHARALASTF